MTNVLGFFQKWTNSQNVNFSLKMVLVEVVILSENKFILWILSVLPKVYKIVIIVSTRLITQMSESSESVNFIETLETEMCFRSSFLEFVG
jgi:hypothetical protein